MKLPRPRFTVRWMMVVVAVVGTSLGITIERRTRFEKLAAHHRVELADLISRMNSIAPDDPIIGRAQWRRRMMDKYDHAARHPWLPVWPDPPEPE